MADSASLDWHWQYQIRNLKVWLFRQCSHFRDYCPLSPKFNHLLLFNFYCAVLQCSVVALFVVL